MARALPVEFEMNFQVEYETVIRKDYVYKCVWTPLMNEKMKCKIDTRSEAKEHDENAIDVYRVTQQLDSANDKNMLVGHVLVELSRLMKNFLEASTENKLVAQVKGKRKREVGLVVPAKCTAFTKDEHFAKIIKRDLNKKTLRNCHFELTCIFIQKKNPEFDLRFCSFFPVLF